VKTVRALLAGALAFVLAGFVAAPAVSARAAEPVRTALWRVADADTTIWLFGTFHMLPPGQEALSPWARRAFDEADTLVVEAILPEDPAALTPLLVELGVARDGKPLSARLTPAQANRLSVSARAAGLDPATLEPLRPWLAATTLATSALSAAGLSHDAGADMRLKTEAKAANKPVEALETVRDQFGFLAGLPEREETAMLVATLDDLDGLEAEMRPLLRRWLRGDADGVARALNRSLRATPGLSRTLLADRNARWAAWIDDRLDRPGVVFMAVGVGHLGGPDSVQVLLQRRGLTATRITR
jgi:uncharacterized protein